MKSNQRVAITIAALLLAASGSARATDPEPKAEDATPTERAQVATVDAEGTGSEARGCERVCLLDEMPVYVPPSRGSVAHRIGGATRGGDLRS